MTNIARNQQQKTSVITWVCLSLVAFLFVASCRGDQSNQKNANQTQTTQEVTMTADATGEVEKLPDRPPTELPFQFAKEKVRTFEASFAEVSGKLGVDPSLLYTRVPSRQNTLPTREGEPLVTWLNAKNPRRYLKEEDQHDRTFRELPLASAISVRLFPELNKTLIAGGSDYLSSVQEAKELDLLPVRLSDRELKRAEQYFRQYGIGLYYQELLWTSIEIRKAYPESPPDSDQLMKRASGRIYQMTGEEFFQIEGHDEIWEEFKPKFWDSYKYGGDGDKRVQNWDAFRGEIVCWMAARPDLEVNWDLYRKAKSEQWLNGLSCWQGDSPGST